MEMAEAQANGLVSVQTLRKLTFAVDGDTYELLQSADAVTAPVTGRDSGRRLEVLTGALPAGHDREAVGLEARYPHLSIVQRTPGPLETSELLYELFAALPREEYENIGTVLFGETAMNMTQRLALSLSLAAAFSELEDYLAGRRLSCFRMDAVLVERDTFRVRLDLIRLLAPIPAEESAAEYRRMRAYGLMPPECYEDPGREPVDAGALRHILAVLVFRCLTAADPFDGSRTLREYPYRTERTLRLIYGYQAAFVCAPGGGNGIDRFIGGSAGRLGRICPRLKQIFLTAFCDGVTRPEKRPAAARWLDNQRSMVNWWTSVNDQWRIPDLETGEGALNSIRYLCMDRNDTVLPVTDGRVVYQYMLDAEQTPLDDHAAGTIRTDGGEAMLVFSDGTREPVSLGPSRPQGIPGTVRERPWEHHDTEEAQV